MMFKTFFTMLTISIVFILFFFSGYISAVIGYISAVIGYILATFGYISATFGCFYFL